MKRLRRKEGQLMQNKPGKAELLLFLIAIAITAAGIYYLGPSITGFVIKEFSYADDLNLVITSSGNYTWQLKDIGALKSAKLDGRVTTYGKARVYIESGGMRYLLFDSTRIGETKKAKENESVALITGFAVEEDEEEKGKGKEDWQNKTESDEERKKKNKKPEWIGVNEFVINDTIQINLSLYFTDEDEDSLVYSASIVEGLEITINGEIATIKPISDKNFNTTITFTASDGIDSKSETVNLIVIVEKEEFVQPNRAPIWNSDVSTFVINGTTAINLSQYFTDEDNDSLSFSSGLVENITISINNELMTLAPAEGFSGSASTAFAAYDGNNLTIKIVTLVIPERVGVNITEPVNITPKINHAPKWEGIDSFILNKTLTIDLLQYFSDEDNDTLAFSVSDAVDVSESISASILTLTATLDNFNTTIVITASDGNLSAGKDVKIIVPLTIIPPINITKTITINLAYNSGTIYDANDNGEESINGVVDLSVEGTSFNWDADASKLCTRWEVYNAEEESLTTFCNGDSECCAFIGLLPTRSNWSEVYYSTFGKDDAGYGNIVSSQVLYYDVNLSIDNPKSEIYYSEWDNLSVKFFEEEIEFFGECIETCALTGLNKSSYTLVFEMEDDAVLRIDRIKYSVLVDVRNNAPLLLKDFPTINVSKNKNATINLSQYFSDPDGDALSYGYYKADNITILFAGDIATILPDKGIEGVRFTFITANDSENVAASNVFMLNISEAKFKPRVEIGKPVKWQSKILVDVSNASSVNLTLPETASNITIRILNETLQKELPDEKVKVIEDGIVKDKGVFEIGKRLENLKKKISILEEARLKNALSVEVDSGKFESQEIDAKLNELYSKKSGLEQQLSQLLGANLITGNIVALTEIISALNGQPVLFINESLAKNIEVEIEYETEAPIAIENEINAYTKQIKVVSETSYEDVLSYTTVNDVPQQAVKLYWIQNNEKILFENVNYIDLNENGLIDRIEWVIPHLSNQTFEVSITILNVQSYPTVGGNWTVVFNTTGTGNLTIYGYNGTSYAEKENDDSGTEDDLDILELRCENNVLEPLYIVDFGNLSLEGLTTISGDVAKEINKNSITNLGNINEKEEKPGSQKQAIEPQVNSHPFIPYSDRDVYKLFVWVEPGWQKQALRLPQEQVGSHPSGFKTSFVEVPALAPNKVNNNKNPISSFFSIIPSAYALHSGGGYTTINVEGKTYALLAKEQLTGHSYKIIENDYLSAYISDSASEGDNTLTFACPLSLLSPESIWQLSFNANAKYGESLKFNSIASGILSKNSEEGIRLISPLMNENMADSSSFVNLLCANNLSNLLPSSKNKNSGATNSNTLKILLDSKTSNGLPLLTKAEKTEFASTTNSIYLPFESFSYLLAKDKLTSSANFSACSSVNSDLSAILFSLANSSSSSFRRFSNANCQLMLDAYANSLSSSGISTFNSAMPKSPKQYNKGEYLKLLENREPYRNPFNKLADFFTIIPSAYALHSGGSYATISIEGKTYALLAKEQLAGHSYKVIGAYYENYNCDNKTGYWTVKVLTSGVHNQRFNFSNQIADAHNLASAQNVTTPYKQFVDDKAADFNLGNYTGTITDGENVTLWNGTIELSPDYDLVNTVLLMHFNNGTGEYEAEINESNVNLILLMHFNNDTGTGENASLFLSNATFGNGTGIGNGTCNLANNLCPAFNESGTKLGRAALTFDGTNDYVNTTFNPNARIGNSKPYTISSWIKLRSVVSKSAIVNANTGAGDRFYFIVNDDTAQHLRMGVGGTIFDSTTAILPDIWQHVAATYDGTDAKIYINGVLDKTQNVGAATLANEVMKIGTEQGAGYFFNGTMDELAIWNISLSADKIAEHAGAKIIDYSNYKNNGTRVFNTTSDFGRNFTAGKFNKGLVFDGVNNYVPINASKTIPIYKNANAYSVSAWINRKSTSAGDDTIYGESDSGSADAFPRFYIRTGENGVVGILIFNDAGTQLLSASSTGSITFDVWHHIVWTDNNGAAKLYIDGVQDSNFTYTRSGTFNNFNTSTIGVLQYNVLTAWFDGTIDEIRIMNISLSAGEILRDYYKGNSTHYNNLTGNFTSRVFDANRSVRFDTIMWNETIPRSELANQSGMVLLMHFNNETGENDTLFYDYTGLGNNGTCVLSSNQCPSYNKTEFKFGGAGLTFDGVNDFINITNTSFIPNSIPMNITLEAWVKPKVSFSVRKDVMSKNAVYDLSIGSALSGGTPNRPSFRISGTGSVGWAIAVSPDTIDTNWHHIVGVYDRSNAFIYVDGILKNKTAADSTIDNQPNYLAIGANTADLGGGFNGTIDEVAIYNRSLSAYEIYDHYSRGAERYINISYRTSADNVTWGSWAYTKNNATLTSITGRYMQYRADFFTNSTLFTPYLENVTINYSVVTNLTVWDETDATVRVLGQPVRFYANFTDIGNNSINGTNINCSFSHNNTGSFSAETNMSFNSTLGIYFIDQQFFTNWTAFYNITCDATALGYNKVKVLDDFIIYPSLNITVNLNATSTLASRPISVSGKVNLSNGTNVSNTRIFIYVNGTEQATASNFTDTSDTDFNKGMYNQTNFSGTGGAANVTLYINNRNYTNDSNTVLLLHFNGTDASTSFSDDGNGTKTMTANGNAQIDTAQSKFDGSSGLFDGTGDYLTAADSADWAFGTGDFTIDFWVRFNSLTATQLLLGQGTADTPANRWYFYKTDVNELSWVVYTNGVNTIWFSQPWSPATNTWYHIAVVRTGNDFKAFVDGTQLGATTTDTDSVEDYAGSLYIAEGSTLVGDNLNGWLDEFRISKGIARWTSDFAPNGVYNRIGNFTSQTFDAGGITNWTYFSWNDFANNKYGKDLEDVKNASTVLLMHFEPATQELTANASTILLMHFNNGTGENDTYFIDSSQYGNNANCTGTWCPVYNSSSRLGNYSLTFDGTDDLVNVTNDAMFNFGGKDFTIELWLRKPVGTTQVIVEKWGGGGWTFYTLGSNNLNGLELVGCSGTCITTSSRPISLNVWHHVAVTRSGSVFRFYVDGAVIETATNANTIAASSVPLIIGARRGDPPSTQTQGTMDELAIWNVSLNRETIIRHAGYGIDSSQYRNNATFMNGSANLTNFKFGEAAWTFDGKKSIINLTNPAPLQMAGSQITLEAWIRPLDLITGGQGIISKWVTGPSDASYLLMVTGNQLQFSFTEGTNNYNAVSASGDLLLDKWQHVAGTYDGTTQSLYLDGNLVKSQSASGNIQNSDNDVLIGVYGNNMQTFNGTIDEVAIWNISFNADEIKRHAMRGLTNLSIYYATSNDTVTWSDWSRATNNTLTTLNMSARYLRYLAKFNTSATNLTPILHDVTINYSGIFTNSFGNYNYTLTAPSGAGTYPIKVNATWSSIPGEQSVDLKVIAGPVIQNNYTIPLYPKFNENVTFFINVTDGNGQQDIIWVNFTIIAPNGTKVVNNTNATFQSGSHYNITYNLTSYGTWYWNISVYDTDGFITNSSTGTILLMQITESLNATSTLASRPISVSGKVNLSNGTNVTNWIIDIYVNGTRESTNKTFTDDTDTDFNKGVYNQTNISGTGGIANVTLLNESVGETYTTGDDGQFNDYSSDVATGGTASASSAPNGAAANAFDNDIATYWGAAGEPAWLKYDFGAGNAKKINRITVRTKYGGGADSNRIWAFNGSNNDVDWTTLDNLPDQGGVSTDNIVTIPNFSNNVAYRYYLLNILDTAGGWPGIYEMEMMESIWIAQSFTPSASATIKSVDLYLLRDASANGSVSVEIQNDNSTNAPNGTIVASPVNVTASSLGTSAGWISFNVGDASLSANTKYWIVLKRTSATAGNVSWRYDGSSPTYTGGESATSSDSGSTWVNDSSRDLLFRTYKGFTSGNFTSQSFDANKTLTWQYISWNNATSVNTNLTLYTRTSADNATWSAWFQHGTSPSLISQNAINRYLQYLAKFNTSNISITPTLFNVTVNVSLATDSFGNYNYTLTAPSSAGTYPIKVNATWNSIPGEQTQNLIVKNAQTINCQVASCFIVQNSSAGYLAVIDSMGNINVFGILTSNAEPTADINDFIVQNSTGGLNLVITNPEGNLLIKKELTQSQGTLSPTLSAFIVQNKTGAVVAYANSTGGLFLTGALTDQVLFE